MPQKQMLEKLSSALSSALRSTLSATWDNIWFTPQPSTAIALYRIFYSALLIQSLALMWPHLTEFYGANAIVSYATGYKYAGAECLNMLSLLPHNDQVVSAFFATTFIAAIMLLFGLFTRLSNLIVYVGILTLHDRNTFIINSGDVLMHLGAYYLLFSNAGDLFSLDRLIRLWRGKTLDKRKPNPKSPWAQRLLQWQVALVYYQATWTKLTGYTWLNGTAVYNVLHQQEYMRIAIPFIANNLWLCKMLTWGTLFIEGSMFTLIWIRPLRYYVLAATILLHLGIDMTMSLSIFEWIMIASLIVFVYPEDLTGAMDWVKSKLRQVLGEPKLVTFDGSNMKSAKWAETLRRLDIFERFRFQDLNEPYQNANSSIGH